MYRHRSHADPEGFELWTKEDQDEFPFQYVVDLRNRIESTCKVARENLYKAQGRQARFYNRKAKARNLKVGDKVLILIPNKANKANKLMLVESKGFTTSTSSKSTLREKTMTTPI